MAPTNAWGLEVLIDQMRRCIIADLWFPALVTALTLPDICGAIESDNGKATGAKTKSWMRRHLPTAQGNEEAAKLIWELRCSLLHQASMRVTNPRAVAFFVPRPDHIELHNVAVEFEDGETYILLSVPEFVEEIATTVEQWISSVRSTRRFATNVANCAHLRTDDLGPAIPDAWLIR